jgi:hypothetical protein
MNTRLLMTLVAIGLGCHGVAHAQSYQDIYHPVHVRSYYKPSTGEYIQEHWRALPSRGPGLYGAVPNIKKLQGLQLPHMTTHDEEEDELGMLSQGQFLA